MNQHDGIERLVRDCAHFPERHYEWQQRTFAHCAICGTDYSIEKLQGVTLNGAPVYVAARTKLDVGGNCGSAPRS